MKLQIVYTTGLKMRENDDYGGNRVIFTKGKYKGKKGFISIASKFGIYVDIDVRGLRVLSTPDEFKIIKDNGDIDK